MIELWPWLALAGLGLFHGLNPAMGWLFAVALGLHRNDERIVYIALLPIAAGHALAIAAVVALVMVLGAALDPGIIAIGSGALLIGWALWHALYHSRHRVRVGMQAGLLGLAFWSFLMATAHGAGLMLVPALVPLHAAHMHAGSHLAGSAAIGLAAVAVHTAAMLLATGVVAAIVYRWLGLAVLKSGWINFDLLWIAMLVLAGTLLIVVGLR
jgi:hypothetical protein